MSTQPAATTQPTTTPTPEGSAPAAAAATTTSPSTAVTAPPAAAATAPAGAEPPKVSPKPEDAKPNVPERYELKLPEGSILDAAHVEKIAAYAKQQGLSQAQAQALLERENSSAADYQKSFVEANKPGGEAWKARVQSFEAAIHSDKELGGEATTRSVELAKRVVARFGTPELKAQLDQTGLGSHPELVRLLSRIGGAMGEDQLVTDTATTTPGSPPKSMAEKFYGGTSK